MISVLYCTVYQLQNNELIIDQLDKSINHIRVLVRVWLTMKYYPKFCLDFLSLQYWSQVQKCLQTDPKNFCQVATDFKNFLLNVSLMMCSVVKLGTAMTLLFQRIALKQMWWAYNACTMVLLYLAISKSSSPLGVNWHSRA